MVALVGRLFVAVALSEDVRHALVAHLDATWGDTPLPGRPVIPPNWHLTLRFLGKTSEKEYDLVLHELDVADLGSAFRLGFGNLGAFPNPGRATVLWLGIERGQEALRSVAATVEEAVSDAGWLPEERPFHPHLTLSRIRPHQDVANVITETPAFPSIQQVGTITIYRSHLRGGPPQYEVMDTIALA